MVHTTVRGRSPKMLPRLLHTVRTIVPKEFIDPCVQVIDDLHGKVEHTHLMDIDFTDPIQFPLMAIHAFMDCTILQDGTMSWEWKSYFLPLQESTLMSLSDLPVFDTTGEVSKCTKFFIILVHNNTLWLDKGYPIHVMDIHQLIGLSMDDQDVMDGFQGLGKHG
jgi:hypothetical protein